MRKSLLFSLFLLMSTSLIAQEFKVPRIFNDHMVLQRDQPLRFWGWDMADQEVAITIGGETVTTTTNDEGQWEAFLPKQFAGGPHTITIKGSGTAEFTDVYFGDVWIAGGQSNMEMQVGANINNMEAELNDAEYPQIRFFRVPKTVSVLPQDDLESGEWKVAGKENAKDFSAVAWFFAKHNHKEKGVPVGIIDDNWGGTPIESWTPIETLLSIEETADAAQEIADMRDDWEEASKRNSENNVIKYQRVEDKTEFLKYGAHAFDYDDSDWETVQLPNKEPLYEFVWLRKEIDLQNVDDATLYFGWPGKFSVGFLNGEQIFVKTYRSDPGEIQIDKSLLREGKNVLAIRTVEDWDNRTFFGREGEMWLKMGNENINLEGAWKFSNTVEPKVPVVKRFENEAGTLYNSMINPVAGYTLKGALWYQGESNVDRDQDYNELFEAMIEDWRSAWNQGSFPFLFVQLANYQQRFDYPTDSGWARIQEKQTQTLSLANTGMACIIDIGEANDIHPRNKQDVGTRLWLAALKVVFGEQLVYSGPMYRGHVIKDGKVEVAFNHTGSGLEVRNPAGLVGFAIAGADQKFYWADAEIVGDRIVLSSPEVKNPVAVRYGWADNPVTSLYNREGLPAVPFRTDEW